MSARSAIRTIEWLTLTTVVLAPLIFWRPLLHPFTVIKTAVFQTGAEAIFFLWVWLAILDKRYRVKWEKLQIAVGIFLLAVTTSAFLGEDVMASLWSVPGRAIGLVSLWHFGALFFALSSLGNVLDWRKIFKWSLFAASLAAVGAIFSAWFPALARLFVITGGRQGSFFNNPTYLAGYLLFHIFISALFFMESRSGAKKALYALMGVAMVMGLMFTETRGDILGLLFGLVVFGLLLLYERMKGKTLAPEQRRRILGISLFSIAILSAVLLILLPKMGGVDAFYRFSPEGIKSGMQNRLYVWGGAWKAFLEKPVLGWGIENFNLAFARYYDPRILQNEFGETFWDKPHNIFLEYAVTGGAVGLFAYLFLLGNAFYLAYKRRNRFEAVVFVSLLSAYAVRSLVFFDTLGTLLPFFLLLSYLGMANGALEERPSGRPLPFAWVPILSVLVIVYFLNAQMIYGMRLEHKATSAFIERRIEDSELFYRQALSVNNPYRQFAWLGFRGLVREAYGEGINYPNMEKLQAELIEESQKIIDKHPKNFAYYVDLALFKIDLSAFGKSYLDDAERLLQKALELSPSRQQIYYALAKAKLRRGDLRGAYDLFERAVNLNPMAGDPHFYFALMAYGLGDLEKGDIEYARSRELGRMFIDADEAITFGTIMGDVRHNYEEAISSYTAALRLAVKESQTKEAILKLAVAYYLNGNPAEAKKTFESAAEAGIRLRDLPSFKVLQALFDELGISY